MRAFSTIAALALIVVGGQGATTRERMPAVEPVIIDLDGAGIRLTSAENGVKIDLVGDGVAKQTAWTQAGSGTGILVEDKNRSGTIEIPQELVGGRGGPPNGFAALRAFDGFGDEQALRSGAHPNPDGKMDSRDAYYSRVIVWVDTNHNGIPEEAELESLAHAGIVSILTGYEDVSRPDGSGNLFRYYTQAYKTSKKGVEVKRDVYVVALAQR